MYNQQNDFTPLVQAIQENNQDLVILLIEKGENINTPSNDVRENPPKILRSFLRVNIFSTYENLNVYNVLKVYTDNLYFYLQRKIPL